MVIEQFVEPPVRASRASRILFNTGKGVYRYYACSRAIKQGKTACEGQRIRMDRLDELVLGYPGFDEQRGADQGRNSSGKVHAP